MINANINQLKKICKKNNISFFQPNLIWQNFIIIFSSNKEKLKNIFDINLNKDFAQLIYFEDTVEKEHCIFIYATTEKELLHELTHVTQILIQYLSTDTSNEIADELQAYSLTQLFEYFKKEI